MRESYEDLKAIANSPKGVNRLVRFRWWYVALLAVGIGIAVYMLVRVVPEATQSFKNLSSLPLLITQAYAQGAAAPTPDYRPIIMMAVIGALLIILLGSVWVMLTGTNPDAIKSASDLAKLLVGFFVGVATKYIGA